MRPRTKTICRAPACGRVISEPGYCDRHQSLAKRWDSNRQAAGNPGKRKLNHLEPDFGLITNIDPPEWLGNNAAEMWRRVVPMLCKQQVLEMSDIHNVEVFCVAYGNFREAQKELLADGIVYEGKKHPAATVITEASKQMALFGSLLGLDPSSRQRLFGVKPKGVKTNPFEALM
ncbi:MAG: phage terminase small subunit P27 family [Burkholderiales bacterium]|jgi:P27 family predicted phage terminase small subunit|nr:phage terminase small subunit P27 family [Burkholderiales bacterium]